MQVETSKIDVATATAVEFRKLFADWTWAAVAAGGDADEIAVAMLSVSASIMDELHGSIATARELTGLARAMLELAHPGGEVPTIN